MDALTGAAASGLRARIESLDMLANNLANTETGGYKIDREFYSLYVAPEAAGADFPVSMPVIERAWTDFSQGAIRPTGNPLDFALSGKGFFAVDGPAGPLYTRQGAFRLSQAGVLVTPEGYPVRLAGGRQLQTSSQAPLEVTPDGAVSQTGQELGQLAIMNFADADGLAQTGQQLFPSGRSFGHTTRRVGCAGATGKTGRLQCRDCRVRRAPGQRHAPIRDAAQSDLYWGGYEQESCGRSGPRRVLEGES